MGKDEEAAGGGVAIQGRREKAAIEMEIWLRFRFQGDAVRWLAGRPKLRLDGFNFINHTRPTSVVACSCLGNKVRQANCIASPILLHILALYVFAPEEF
ncbi:hypothetical protein IAQ61_008262 [Plenodomus lingam]|uniref:uncharacterized protein n=1 Tax=Leptosphaeria maculans TaxID=5022 RepID=UPI003324274E|nr:hypothetical protein IAQ61_008262 [Plenodomus lingam]